MQQQARDGAVVMLVSPSATPCGVEMFARVLCEAAIPLGLATRTLSVRGDFNDAWRLWLGLAGARALVVNLPVVAWKRALLTPLLALAIARLRGARTILVLHEWADLQPARRAVYSLYLLLAQTVLFSSPFVRAGFDTDHLGRRGRSTGLIPIPSNIAPTKARRVTLASARLAQERARGRVILGHFGSIYPKKQSEVVLDVAAALRTRGCDVFVVFIGGFIRGHGDIETRFFARAEALGLGDVVLVTGYIETKAEIFTLFDACDAFAYAFAEGLTSRRGSVLACLQTGKPVVADAPISADEFAHHRVYRDFIAAGALTFAAKNASPADYARAVEHALASPAHPTPEVFATAWRDAASALRDSVEDEQPALTTASPHPPGRRPGWRAGQRGGVRR
jgi:glycosyltransferase involved in cell wall biosynthesis